MGDENVLKLTVVMDTQLHGYTRSPRLCTLKGCIVWYGNCLTLLKFPIPIFLCFIPWCFLPATQKSRLFMCPVSLHPFRSPRRWALF